MTQGNANLARQNPIDDFLHIGITQPLIQNVTKDGVVTMTDSTSGSGNATRHRLRPAG